MSLMDHFPGTPRGEQENVINRIEEAFYEEDKKFVICQAPTGSGKSHLGATLSRSTSNCPRVLMKTDVTPKSHHRKIQHENIEKFGSYILTTSKQLQDQYLELFPECKVLKGKVNYQCDIDPILNAACAKCAYLPSTMSNCAMRGDCDYINSYSDAVKSNFTVLNYSLFLTLPASFRSKEVLICDEASELEDTLVKHFSITVSYKNLDYLNVKYTKLTKETSEGGFLWISELLQNLKDALPSPKVLGSYKTPKHVVDKAKNIRDMIEKVRLLHNFWNVSEFIVEKTKDGVNISPLKVNKLASVMFRGIDKVLLMSATVINHAKMAESLGIEKGNYEFIDVKSDFNAKKSPIYTAPAKFDMTYKSIDRSIPKLVDSILELSELHGEDNGLIHTHNFKITTALQSAVKGDKRFLFRDKFSTNEDILYEHFNRPDPTVLVSPSLAFGTSLDNEHGRFQIISKLPYLPMSDKRIKMLSERDFEWYQMKMWIKMIQMCGRCTRSKEDHSSTYIFDKSFLNAIDRYDDKLPEWFKDRLI
jgi:ATP-dependent DNA helicase DinG